MSGVTAQLLVLDGKSMEIEFGVRGRRHLLLAPEGEPARTDGLWQTTCFEAFIRPIKSEAYLELNFSPSFAWAAYSFDRYREGMRPLPMRVDPEIAVTDPATEHDYFHLSAEFEPPSLPAPLSLGLSAVIEEKDGTKSYWALRHPPGDRPDFHHPDCFALELPPASDT
ncbi:hypothetical protein GON01_16195 [Sphingomonas sp. MAH-20]|uniref:DOMON-like domain-containing protein n=2 Tax=Sphingomonadaceae TaxID=41297 RepID=A0A6I4J5K2_9SPHN|nr:DOMON-like domain-containing protein [Sphingomonas sp. CGMCC 1.13658]MVO79474.1 hypothetical protein [Sphingomonas horti]